MRPRTGAKAQEAPGGAGFDLRALPATFYDDPYPTYRSLREREPVRAMPDGSVLLTRHADVREVYRDAARFSADKRREFGPKFGDTPLYAHHTSSLVFNDPPRHTRVRRIIAGALAGRVVSAMEPGLARLVETLLQEMAARGRVDLIGEFAAAIPVEAIGNLLDVPRAERGNLRGWSLAILGALEPSLSEAQLAHGNDAVRDFSAFLRDLVAARRRHPGDPARDLLTRLIAAGEEDDTAALDEAELLHNCIFILNAGHETTTNLIGNALHALALWPEQRRRLRAAPALIEPAVEEFLRFESPNQLGNRISTAAAVVGGVPLPAGTPITLCIGAANRDPAQFDAPDRLDFSRVPNRHLAFGLGIHQCAGMSLARLEARIALAGLLARFPDYALDGPPVRGRRARFRGFVSLPARMTG